MKTLGPVGAKLVNTLYEKEKEIFTFKDVTEILGKKTGANEALVSSLVKQNIISRLKRGKYIIIPQKYGIMEKYTGNRYVAAKEIAVSPDYYIAFYSAMEFWGMLTQPLLTIFVAVPKRQQAPKGLGKQFKFVFVKRENIWGISVQAAEAGNTIRVSDREKTIIDALAHPEYCGGITEIAKGMWLVKEKTDHAKMAEYALKYGKNAVIKRLGYLLETLSVCNGEITDMLKKKINDRYDILDPSAARVLTAKNSWHLIDNVNPERIKKVIWS